MLGAVKVPDRICFATPVAALVVPESEKPLDCNPAFVIMLDISNVLNACEGAIEGFLLHEVKSTQSRIAIAGFRLILIVVQCLLKNYFMVSLIAKDIVLSKLANDSRNEGIY